MTILRHRRWLLVFALVAGVAAIASQYGGEPATVASAHTGGPSHSVRARPPADDLPKLELPKIDAGEPREPVGNAFEARSWAPPAPKTRLPQSPTPQAPPLPYTYVGKMMEDGRIVVFLARNERNYAVRNGDKLDGTYQVDDVRPTEMLMTYLPLNQQQSLAIGSAN